MSERSYIIARRNFGSDLQKCAGIKHTVPAFGYVAIRSLYNNNILCFLNFLCKVLINLFMLYITFFSIALPIVSPLHLPNLALYICTYVRTYNIIASFGLMELVVAQIRPKTWEGIMCVCSYVCVCVASFVRSPQTIC